MSKVRHRLRNADTLIGQIIRRSRQERGISQQELANRIGVTYQQVHKYERGMNRISVGVLVQAAQALDLNLSQVFAEFDAEAPPLRQEPGERQILEHARTFAALSEPNRKAVNALARSLEAAQNPIKASA